MALRAILSRPPVLWRAPRVDVLTRKTWGGVVHILAATGGLVPPERSLETRTVLRIHSHATARLVRVDVCEIRDRQILPRRDKPAGSGDFLGPLSGCQTSLRRDKLGGGVFLLR